MLKKVGLNQNKKSPCDSAREDYNNAVNEFQSVHQKSLSAVSVRDAVQSAFSEDSFWQDAVDNAPDLASVASSIIDSIPSPEVFGFGKSFLYDIPKDIYDTAGAAGNGNYNDALNSSAKVLWGANYSLIQGIRYLGGVADAYALGAGPANAERFAQVRQGIGRNNAALLIGTLAIENFKIYGSGYFNTVDQNTIIGALNDGILGHQATVQSSLDKLKRSAEKVKENCK